MDLLEDVCGEWVRLVIEHGRDMVHLRMSSRYPATAAGTVVSGPGAGVSSHHGSVPPSGEPSPARPHRASASPDGVGTGPPLRAVGSHPVLLAPDPAGGGRVCGRLRVLPADPTAGRGWHRWRRVGAVAPSALRRTPRSCSSSSMCPRVASAPRAPRGARAWQSRWKSSPRGWTGHRRRSPATSAGPAAHHRRVGGTPAR